MKRLPFLLIMLIFSLVACSAQPQGKVTNNKNTDTTSVTTVLEPTIMDSTKFNKLTDEEKRVILNKGTEYPFSGKYVDNKETGIYTCKQCNQPLFESTSKFNSGTGWPSFDAMIGSNVREIPDADGHRTEIVCGNCGGHLGHVFKGEGFTPNNTRHCVNSVSLDFVPADQSPRDTAVFASGCFWGTEYFLQQIKGVIDTKPGYIGGTVKNPSYRQVCSGMTGHYEAVRVIYNPDSVSYEEIAKMYFETHDPEQVGGQGPDIGPQYQSAIFYFNEAQKAIAEKLMAELEAKGLKLATELKPASTFWVAEDYHQDYYIKTGKVPYCHGYVKRF